MYVRNEPSEGNMPLFKRWRTHHDRFGVDDFGDYVGVVGAS
jgi:hypothetical protein